MVDSFHYEIKEIRSTNQDIKTYIDICKKKCVAYPEQRTAYLENIVNITVDSDSVIPQEKKTFGRDNLRQKRGK